MALITRISRLFRADVNAVLDRIEEPELLLKQAVREMQEALDLDVQRRRSITMELQRIGTLQAETDARLARTADELDLCFANGNETLARVLLRRRLESEAFARFLERKREELQAAASDLARRIDENQGRLDSMRQKAAVFVAREDSSGTDGAWTESAFARQFVVSDDDVELALLRERQQRVTS